MIKTTDCSFRSRTLGPIPDPPPCTFSNIESQSVQIHRTFGHGGFEGTGRPQTDVLVYHPSTPVDPRTPLPSEIERRPGLFRLPVTLLTVSHSLRESGGGTPVPNVIPPGYRGSGWGPRGDWKRKRFFSVPLLFCVDSVESVVTSTFYPGLVHLTKLILPTPATVESPLGALGPFTSESILRRPSLNCSSLVKYLHLSNPWSPKRTGPLRPTPSGDGRCVPRRMFPVASPPSSSGTPPRDGVL